MNAMLQEKPADMSVTLHMDATLQKQIMQSEGALTVAHSFVIDSPEMAQIASDERRDLAQRIDNLEAARKKFIAPAQEIIENAKALFNPAIGALKSARDYIGQQLLAWDQKEKARIAAENAECEAIARKVRQEADAKAAAERAKAEEKAREERRKAAEAEEARQRAIAEGNARAAAAAAAEAARANERAAAAIEDGNAKAMQAQIEATAMATVPAVEPTKIVGSSIKDNWVPKLKDGFTAESALEAIVKEAGANPQLRGLLNLDMSALRKWAKSPFRHTMQVPGYVAVNDPTLAGTRK